MDKISKAPLKKMLKDMGAKQVSNRAVELFSEILEEETTKICKQAQKLAEHDERATVKKEDIRIAKKITK